MSMTWSLFLFFAFTVSAQAQTRPAPTPSATASPSIIVISGWRLACSLNATSNLACEVLNRVTVRANNAVVGAVSVRLASDGKTPTILAQVPLGTAIPNAVRAGTKSGTLETLAIVTCTRDGCFARAPLGEPLLNAMRAAKEPLRIVYETPDADSASRTVTIELGLAGFSATSDKLH